MIVLGPIRVIRIHRVLRRIGRGPGLCPGLGLHVDEAGISSRLLRVKEALPVVVDVVGHMGGGREKDGNQSPLEGSGHQR